MYIIYLIIGILIGFVIGALYYRSKQQGVYSSIEADTLKLENAKLQERVSSLSTNMDELNKNITLERDNHKNTHSQLARAEEALKNIEEKLRDQQQEQNKLEEKFTKEFENLANKILNEKSEKFVKLNKDNLDIILNPLKEKIKDFEEKVDKSYKTEAAERNSLKGEIKNLVELSQQLGKEATNLTNALKGDTKQQGNWGELILEKILERSGLTKEVEYKLQVSTSNSEGKKIQPDAVIFLPDSKHIIVDSKVSLLAYEAAVNASTDIEREQHIKEHIISVKAHIKGLSEKNYQTSGDFSTPDFVLLFMPIESSFSLAIQADQDIFNFAWDRKIVIVSPSTLLATLRTIASMWKHERQTKNVLEIAEESGKLYDKFVGFVDDLLNVGNKIKSAKDSYEEAMKKLSSGTGNIVKRTENLKKLGAKATKELPNAIIERSIDNE